MKRTGQGRVRALAEALAEAGRSYYARGWVLGTSGNFSAVVSRQPLRLVITPSGADKGALAREQFLLVDDAARALRGRARPSAETLLHLTIVRLRGASAVMHTHSVWSTLLSQQFAAEGGLGIAGYEMLKGLAGVTTHEHREWLPIIENSQDMQWLAARVAEAAQRFPDSHAFLLRGHGMYTWGEDVGEARRHVEILEFLLEVVGRSRTGSAAEPPAAKQRRK